MDPVIWFQLIWSWAFLSFFSLQRFINAAEFAGVLGLSGTCPGRTAIGRGRQRRSVRRVVVREGRRANQRAPLSHAAEHGQTKRPKIGTSKNWKFGRLPVWTIDRLSSSGSEAVATVDRPTLSRLEGDRRRRATFGANCVKGLPRGPTIPIATAAATTAASTTLGFSFLAASSATLGFVGESTFSVAGLIFT